ncbi:MAG: VOC family protein [Spirochaetales bacterium]|nr:VOC family protein [Spirochaetales bacterium]
MDTSKIKGIDHIGIPTKDIEATIAFYEKLGLKVSFRTKNPNNGHNVAFLTLNDLVIETYEAAEISGKNGAVDHFSLLVSDVESLYKEALDEGYEILTNGIETLPFWENGVSFFKVKGPNGEAVELLEKL